MLNSSYLDNFARSEVVLRLVACSRFVLWVLITKCTVITNLYHILISEQAQV